MYFYIFGKRTCARECIRRDYVRFAIYIYITWIHFSVESRTNVDNRWDERRDRVARECRPIEPLNVNVSTTVAVVPEKIDAPEKRCAAIVLQSEPKFERTKVRRRDIITNRRHRGSFPMRRP